MMARLMSVFLQKVMMHEESSLVAPTTPRMRLAMLMRREFKELAQNDGDSSFAGNSDCQYVCTVHFYLRDKPDVWSCVVGNKERGRTLSWLV